MSFDTPRIGFLGAGKMATALARGWLAAGLTHTDRILASDPSPQARESFTLESGAAVVAGNLQVVSNSELLVLAVKPQSMQKLLTEIRPSVTRYGPTGC